MSAKKQFTLANGCFNLNEWFDTDCISIAVADSASVAMRWWKNITTYYGQLLCCPVPLIFDGLMLEFLSNAYTVIVSLVMQCSHLLGRTSA